MKKALVMFAALLLSSVVPLSFASSAGEKTAEGRTELGGDFHFISSSYEGASITSLALTPRIGLFVSPGVAFEPKLLLVHQTINPDRGGSYSATDFGTILNVAYHFEGRGESDYVPFIFGGVGFVTHSGDVGPNDEWTIILPDIGGGIKVFFTNSALLRAEIFFQNVTNANGVEDSDATEFGLRAGVSVFVK
jgi:hypothetical protein